MAAAISSAGRPWIGGIPEPGIARTAWHPEQAAAPGGAAVSARAGAAAARTARASPAAVTSRRAQVRILQRQGADALARRSEDRVENGGRGDRDGRLPDPAPEAAGRNQHGLHLRHLVDAHDVVGVEVLLDDPTVLDRALAVKAGRQAVDERALHLGR